MFAPMTFLVTVGMILAVFTAVTILMRAFGESKSTTRGGRTASRPTCPRCRQRNRRAANYCARCGKKMPAQRKR